MALRRRQVLGFYSAAFGTFTGVLLASGVAVAQTPDSAVPPPAAAPPAAQPPAAPAPDLPAAGPAAPAQPPAAAPAPENAAPPAEAPAPTDAAPAAPASDAAPPSTPPAAEQAASDAAAPDTTLGAVTITARHRTENLQEVPIAVTHLSARDLDAQGAVNLRQVQLQVPSLQILGFNPRNVTIQIRGLGTTAGTVNSGIEPGVGVYVNGVYYARPAIAVFDQFDVESIDVLRGPQGTLFGKNTVAGVIDIRTNEASYTPELNLELSYGNFQYTQVKFAASAPIGKTGFAVRLAGIKTDRDGTIYNTIYRDSWQDLHNQGIRGEVAYRTDDRSFKARLIADYNNQQQYSGFNVGRGALPKTRNDGSTATSRDFYDRSKDLNYTPLPFDPAARQIDLNTPFTVNMQTGGVSLQLDKTLPAAHNLTSISAYRFWNWDPSLDGDRTGRAINIASNLPTNQKQFSQELRVASGSGKTLEYTGGLYYFWQRTKEVPYNTYGADAGKWLLGPAFPDESLENWTQSGYQNAVLNSYSAFANATWHAIEKKLDVSGGLRFTYETRKGRYESFPIADNAVPLTDPVFAGLTEAQIATIASRRNSFAPTAEFDASTKGGRPSGTLNLLYRVTPDINVYGGYSRGFKSAGINMAVPVQLANGPAPKTFKPEIVDAFEIGFKTKLFDQRLLTNVAFFLSDDRGYQANQSILVDTPTGPIARSYLTNAGDVRTQGVELDLRAKPIDGLTIGGGATYNDAYFRNYKNGTCPYLQVTAANGGVCDLSGRQLTGVSKLVYNVNAEYQFPLPDTATLAYVGGNWSYRSEAYGSLNTDPYAKIPGYGIAGAYLGVRGKNGAWDLKFWGRNLFDKTYFVNASVDTATTYTYSGTLGDPRFYGTTFQLNL
jgi:iron complex outermembrane recepter protein